jgi:hypothetical protein
MCLQRKKLRLHGGKKRGKASIPTNTLKDFLDLYILRFLGDKELSSLTERSIKAFNGGLFGVYCTIIG